MNLFSHPCPECGSEDVYADHQYKTKNNGVRKIYHCRRCDIYFSETFGTPIAGLTTNLSRIIEILKARSEGMGLNATARTFSVSKKSVIDWERRLGGIKPTLMLYALLQKFIHQDIEGDEVYTKVRQNVPAPDSEGWTIVLMERASRFLWELQCGGKDQLLFEEALQVLAEVIAQTGSLSLFTDGERRYRNLLFDICHQVFSNGSVGRPAKKLLKGVRVRLKNKGAKKKSGRPRKKYQVPVPEHPETEHVVNDKDIHANHVEAFNASLRRGNTKAQKRGNR
jgi:transposase-like protein